jgi:hypothetical protein
MDASVGDSLALAVPRNDSAHVPCPLAIRAHGSEFQLNTLYGKRKTCPARLPGMTGNDTR